MDICLIDTSIFDEILNIPGKSQCYSSTIDELDQKLRQKEHLFLPMQPFLNVEITLPKLEMGREEEVLQSDL